MNAAAGSAAALKILLETAKASSSVGKTALPAASDSFAQLSRKLAPVLSKGDADALTRALLVSSSGAVEVAAQRSRRQHRMVSALLRSTADWETALNIERFRSRVMANARKPAHEKRNKLTNAQLRSDWRDRAHCFRLALVAGRPLTELETWAAAPCSSIQFHEDTGASFILSRKHATREFLYFTQTIRKLKKLQDVDTLVNMLALAIWGTTAKEMDDGMFPSSSELLLAGLGETGLRKLVANLILTTAEAVDGGHRHFQQRMLILSCAQTFTRAYGRPPAGFMKYYSKLTADVRPQKLDWFRETLARPSSVSLLEEKGCVLMATVSRRVARRVLQDTASISGDKSSTNRRIVALLSGRYSELTRNPQEAAAARALLAPPLPSARLTTDLFLYRMSCELLQHPKLIKRLRVRPADVVAMALITAPVALAPRTWKQAASFVRVLKHLDRSNNPLLVTWLTHRHLLKPPKNGWVSPLATSVIRGAFGEILRSLKNQICHGGSEGAEMARRCRLLDLLEHAVVDRASVPVPTDVSYADLAIVSAASLERGVPFGRLRELLLKLCNRDDSIINYVRILSCARQTATAAAIDGSAVGPSNPLLRNRRLLLALWHLQSRHCGDNLVLLRLQCRLMVELLREKYSVADPQLFDQFKDAIRILSTLHLCGAKFSVCVKACGGGCSERDQLLLESEDCGGSDAAAMVQLETPSQFAGRQR